MNTPVLMWHPTPEKSNFGLGGEFSSPPLCACGTKMSHVAVFPHKKDIVQFFYCTECEIKEGFLSKDQKKTPFALSFLSPIEALGLEKKLNKESDFCPWVSYKSTSATMSPRPNALLNEYAPDRGVYMSGFSTEPSPHCQECQKAMELLLTLDSFAHENFNWGDFGTLHLWICPRHRNSVVLKIK